MVPIKLSAAFLLAAAAIAPVFALPVPLPAGQDHRDRRVDQDLLHLNFPVPPNHIPNQPANIPNQPAHAHAPNLNPPQPAHTHNPPQPAPAHNPPQHAHAPNPPQGAHGHNPPQPPQPAHG